MPIFKKLLAVVLVQAIAFANDEETIKSIGSLTKLKPKELEVSEDRVLTVWFDRKDKEEGFLTLNEGDWIVKEGDELSVYDPYEFAEKFELQNV